MWVVAARGDGFLVDVATATKASVPDLACPEGVEEFLGRIDLTTWAKPAEAVSTARRVPLWHLQAVLSGEPGEGGQADTEVRAGPRVKGRSHDKSSTGGSELSTSVHGCCPACTERTTCVTSGIL